ncbi:hypothetical protein L1785_13230 [Antribacter sp. KLBMP9083]|uniref:Uncharacterized protein n=1 Tax=Antribacter soli TaxID=2910976 RepID=A0AA41QFP2_9MICO|nr:hypothetical protein [Antribacter soli]MCF4121940.1 hypothetical protein [Antribacter soli]
MSTKPRTDDTTAPARFTRVILTTVKAVVCTVLCIVAYCVSQGMLGGYPQFHSYLLTTSGMVALCITAGVAWVVDERRHRGDD